jgi:hypothetical protein
MGERRRHVWPTLEVKHAADHEARRPEKRCRPESTRSDPLPVHNPSARWSNGKGDDRHGPPVPKILHRPFAAASGVAEAIAYPR